MEEDATPEQPFAGLLLLLLLFGLLALSEPVPATSKD